MGLFGESGVLRKELVVDYKTSGEKPFEFVPRNAWKSGIEVKHEYPLEAPIELEAFPFYQRYLGGGSCIGGGGSGAARVNPTMQVIAELRGCQVMHMPNSNESGDSLFYSAGVRWTPRASHKYSPYAELLFGGMKVTYETTDKQKRNALLKEWSDGSGTLAHYPTRFDWSVEYQANGPALAAGTGLDVVMTRAFAWRVIKMEYMHSWTPAVDMIHTQNGVTISTGAVLRIGTW